MYACHQALVTVLSALFLLVAAAAIADDDQITVILPRDSVSFDLPATALPGLEAGGTPPEIWAQPSRGFVFSNLDGLLYVPGEAFAIKGSDSFRYVDPGNDPSTIVTVFLVADLGRGDDDIAAGETSSGGDTVLVLDIGDPCQQLPCTEPSNDLILAEGTVGEPPVSRFDIYLNPGTGATDTVQARALDTERNEWIETAAVPLPADTREIGLSWWTALEGAPNGGLVLRIDGRLAASLTGLRNGLGGERLDWDCTSVPGASLVGSCRSYRRHYGLPMAFPPRFADTFEGPQLFGWMFPMPVGGPVVHPTGMMLTAAAAVQGQAGLTADTSDPQAATLIEPGPEAARHYRVRFDLNQRCSGEPPSATTVLLRGEQTGQAPWLFELAWVPGPGGPRFVVYGRDDSGTFLSASSSSLPGEAVTIDLEWWAASAPDARDGGLVLRLDDRNNAVAVLQLDNAVQVLDQIRFGVVAATTEGKLCLDELESWY